MSSPKVIYPVYMYYLLINQDVSFTMDCSAKYVNERHNESENHGIRVEVKRISVLHVAPKNANVSHKL